MTDKVSYRIDYTKVDSDLEDFPVDIWITTDTVPASMFNSFFTNDTFDPTEFKVINPETDAELYTEISYYDYSSKEMMLHVKVPDVYSDKYSYVDIVPTITGSNIYVSETDTWQETTTVSGDDFTGDDIDFDHTLWFMRKAFYRDEDYIRIYNNKLKFNIENTTDDQGMWFYSTLRFFGNFDVRVDFEFIGAGSRWAQRMDMFTTEMNAYIGRYNIFADGYYRSEITGETLVHGGPNDSSGKFRIARVGTTLTTYYWGGSSWVNYVESTSCPLTEFRVLLSVNTWHNATSLGSTFDNFTFTADTVKYQPSSTVWDEHYKAVYHMSQDPSAGTNSILDSTYNGWNSSPYGSMTSLDVVDGSIGKALDFDGLDDYIDIGYPLYMGNPDLHQTIEFVSNNDGVMVGTERTSSATGDSQLSVGSNGTLVYRIDNSTSAPHTEWITSSGGADISEFNYYALSAVGVSNSYDMIVNDIKENVVYDFDEGNEEHSNVMVARHRNYTYSDVYYDMQVQEIRFSDITRSDAWLKASGHSIKGSLVEIVYPTVCEGTVRDGSGTTLSGTEVNLHRRVDGTLVGRTTTTSSGTFSVGSIYAEDHYIVALPLDDSFNALIYDYINPTYSGELNV